MRSLFFTAILIAGTINAQNTCTQPTALRALKSLKEIMPVTYCGQQLKLTQSGSTSNYLVVDNGAKVLKLSPEDGATTNKLSRSKNHYLCITGKSYNNCEISVLSASNIKPISKDICGIVKDGEDAESLILVTNWGASSKLSPEDGATMNRLNGLKNQPICLKGKSVGGELSIRSASHIKSFRGALCGMVVKKGSRFELSTNSTSVKISPEDSASSNKLSIYDQKGACLTGQMLDGELSVTSASKITNQNGLKCSRINKVNNKLMLDGRVLQPEDGASQNILANAALTTVCIDANWSESEVSVLSPSKIYKVQ